MPVLHLCHSGKVKKGPANLTAAGLGEQKMASA